MYRINKADICSYFWLGFSLTNLRLPVFFAHVAQVAVAKHSAEPRKPPGPTSSASYEPRHSGARRWPGDKGLGDTETRVVCRCFPRQDSKQKIGRPWFPTKRSQDSKQQKILRPLSSTKRSRVKLCGHKCRNPRSPLRSEIITEL